MKNLITLFIIIFICQDSFGQDSINSFEHYFNLKDKKVKALDVFHNDKSQEVLFLLKDNAQLAAYLFDKNFQEIGDALRIDKDFRRYPIVISAVNSGEHSYSLLLASEEYEKWGLLDFDFKNRSASIAKLPYKIKKAVYLTSFRYAKKHWIISLVRNSSIIRAESIDSNGDVQHLEFDFSEDDFSGGRRSISNMYQLVGARSEDFTTDFIETGTPLSLLSANEKVKFYKEGGTVIMTIDNSRDYTYILEMNVENGQSSAKQINKQKLENRSSYEDSNSFILDDKLFSLKTTFETLSLDIKDLQTQKVLNTIIIKDSEDIWFKNTPIFQENLGSSSEITNTKKFLRKVTNSEPAISVYKQDRNYVLSIGASKYIDYNDEIQIIGAIVGGASGFLTVSIFLNPVSKNYLDYSSTRTTRFQTILDDNFKHIPDATVRRNVFDNIKEFDQSKELKGAKTVYQIGKNYYFSYFDRETNRVNTVKF